jgi:hypothetical protein
MRLRFEHVWILVFAVGVVAAAAVFFKSRESMSSGKNMDNSKNWDVPERKDFPLGTPEGQDLDRMKKRISDLEQDVQMLKAKVGV